jgi:hypothetical protein
MLAYGLANAVQDAWNEQLWKRGWVDAHAPEVIRPDFSWGWLAIVAAAAAIYTLWLRPRAAGDGGTRPPPPVPAATSR